MIEPASHTADAIAGNSLMPDREWASRLNIEWVGKIPYAFAKKHRIIVACQEADGIHVLSPQTPPLWIFQELRRELGQPMKVHLLPSDDFDALLGRAYDASSNQATDIIEDLGEELDLGTLAAEIPETEDLLENKEGAPIVRLLNHLISKAIRETVSDIHLEPHEKHSQIRFRVDGVLQDILHAPSSSHSALVSRLKIMANLDISEKRQPQDGRITLRVGSHTVDVRVSTIPTQYGERAVLRLLDKQNIQTNLRELGMDDDLYQSFTSLFHKPYGILLVTGPTGSGKTTTLYGSLSQLDSVKLNIMTIEDPVEYNLDGIGQTQVHQKIGLDFAAGLRSILRQDPNVILVGEIRDLETARIAVQASLTGHLVLSTLHTNTALGAVTRLIDIGVAPYLIANATIGMLAQRLVRRLCEDCRKPYHPDAEIFNKLDSGLVSGRNDVTIYRSGTCQSCGYQGYRGRLGIFELVTIDNDLRSMIQQEQSEQEMTQYARRHSRSILQDGLAKVLDGITSLEEVLLVTGGS